MQVLNRIPPALPPRPEDSRECVRMRSNEWCPSGRFEVPNSASGRARGHFRQSIIPRFAFLFGLFSVTYLMFVVVLRAGIDLIPRSNPNGRQVFSAPPRAFDASRPSCFGSPPSHGRCRLQIVGHGNELLPFAKVDLVHSDLSRAKSLSRLRRRASQRTGINASHRARHTDRAEEP